MLTPFERHNPIQIRSEPVDKEWVQSLATESAYKTKALKGLGSLPPFSPTLNRLMATLANNDIPFSQIAALIEKDTVLAGNVLRTVNSPLYCFSGTINSVSHAISIMGLSKLRNTALGLSVSRVWTGVRTRPGWSMAKFNLHSLATAILSDQIAQHLAVEYAEGAFVSGLFHDLGKLLIATALPDEYLQINRVTEALPDHDPARVLGIEADLLGLTHADLSASALKLWNLPVPVQTAALYHHSPELAPPEVYGDCQFHLGHVVYAANRTVSDFGISIHSSRTVAEPSVEWLAGLGLQSRAEKILGEFQKEFEAVRVAA
jgi:HD-like signal output (HDOD) protein